MQTETSKKGVYIPNLAVLAENQVTETGYMYYHPEFKGSPVTLTLVEGGMTGTLTHNDVEFSIFTESGETQNFTLTAPKSVIRLNGVYVYYAIADFNAAAPNLDFSAFTGVDGCKCWKVTDGVLGWK